MIKLLLVDDQAVMREAVSVWLGIEPDVTIVGQAESGETALELAPQLQPDVVLMDIDMPTLDGIATTERLRDVAPDCAVVILSMHDDDHVRARAEAAGARGFVSKYQALDQLLDVIRAVATRPATA
ncbi:MAG: response regulator transcription factor [Anaerolineales bacterium]|nr:response regulator transcription factor [Anaerolineales bacterium]